MSRPESTPADVEAYYSAQVEAAFARAAAARRRDPHQLSISQLWRCLRQSAFKLAGTPVDESWTEAVSRQAEIGTWIHEGFLPELLSVAEAASGAIEQAVLLRAAGLSVPGTYDRYEPDAPHGPTVADVKTVGEWRWNQVLDKGVPLEYFGQSAGYSLALIQDKRPVEWLVWIFLNRDSGEEIVKAEPFTPDDAAAVVRRAARIVAAAENPDDPATAPREAPGPSVYLKRPWSPCDGCAWLERCWSRPRPEVAPQAVLLDGDPTGAARAVHSYAAHRAYKKTGEDGMAFNRALLSGVTPGVYVDPANPERAARFARTKNGRITITAAKPPKRTSG